jgi:hypothetical protein
MNLRHALKTSILVAAFAALPLSASFAADDPVPASKDVEIPFANHGGIRDWQADRDRGVWIQDVHNKWYYAKLMGPCLGLDFANSIGFDTRPMGTFDRFSAVIVPRSGKCAVQSLRMSGPPPSHHRQKQAEAAPPPTEG